ncbi:MAG: rod shape-determining protein MreC [Lachnospiraceae bacterium]|nr:rod shape-determining protein MreC [Lachnospiraceae bacterium]
MKPDNKRTPDKLPTRFKLLLGISFCVLLLLITGILSVTLAPFRNAAMTVSSPISDAFTSLADWIENRSNNWQDLQDLQEENSLLKSRVAQLEDENRMLMTQARRAGELEELYAMDTYYRDYPKQGAQIVGLSPNNWYETFLLDRGSNDGIEKYMPVLSGYGLAGHISQVYSDYATVTSIIDPMSTVYAQINRENGDLVVVQGAYGYRTTETGLIEEALCMVRFVTAETNIRIGDELVTSTLGDIYPPGLSIGTVTEIIPVGSGYESLALVSPTCNLEQADMVLIITDLWKSDLSSGDKEEGDE